MASNGDPVQCAGSSLGQNRHVCAFFNGFDEQHRVLRSFIKEGFERGDKAFHIVDPSSGTTISNGSPKLALTWSR
jgi:hypothetical protein